MKSNSVVKYVVLAVFGFLMLTAGIVLKIVIPDAQGIMLTSPYICVGVGAGIFGASLAGIISGHLLKKDPVAAKQKEINTKDERNIAIFTKAKAKAYDLMLMVYSALILAFALMQVDMYVVLAFVAAYLFIIFSMIYYINKYSKMM